MRAELPVLLGDQRRRGGTAGQVGGEVPRVKRDRTGGLRRIVVLPAKSEILVPVKPSLLLSSLLLEELRLAPGDGYSWPSRKVGTHFLCLECNPSA